MRGRPSAPRHRWWRACSARGPGLLIQHRELVQSLRNVSYSDTSQMNTHGNGWYHLKGRSVSGKGDEKHAHPEQWNNRAKPARRRVDIARHQRNGLSLQNWQAEQRLNVKIEAPHLGQRAGEEFTAAGLERHGERERRAGISGALQKGVDTDVVFRQDAGDFRDNTRAVPDDETKIMRNGEFTADGVRDLQCGAR